MAEVLFWGEGAGGHSYFQGEAEWIIPGRKKSIRSSRYRSLHTAVHTSASLHILAGCGGTYINLFGGMYFQGIASFEKSFQMTQKWSWVYSKNRAKTFRCLRHHQFACQFRRLRHRQTDDGVDAETFLLDFLNKLNFTFGPFGNFSQRSCTWSEKDPSTS